MADGRVSSLSGKGVRGWSLALVLLGLGSAVSLLAPLASVSGCTASSTGGGRCTSGHESLLTSQGATVAWVLIVPVLLAVVPLLIRGSRQQLAMTICAVVLLAFCLVGAASVGVFFIPGALVACWAGFARSRAPH